MTEYRLEVSDSQPFREHPSYGVCWRPATPNTRFTRLGTAINRMRERSGYLTAPAFMDGCTRVVEIDGDRRIVLAYLNNAAGLRNMPWRYEAAETAR